MGKVDQGVFTHWMLSHYFRRDLTYLGYGGKGKQVRDLISIDDVVDLVEDQLVDPESLGGLRRQRRRRARDQPLAARDDGALPGADRKRRSRSAAIRGRGRATSRSTCPTAICYTGIPTGGRNAGRSRSWKRSSSGSENNERAVERALG